MGGFIPINIRAAKKKLLFQVRRAIGNLGVVKSDLVHIVRDHANNR